MRVTIYPGHYTVHVFESFIRPRPPNAPTWLSQFYVDYAKALQKKRKGTNWKPLYEVEVRSKMALCHASTINDAL